MINKTQEKFNIIANYIRDYEKFIYKYANDVISKCKMLEVEDVKQEIICDLLHVAYVYKEEPENISPTYLSKVVMNSASSQIKKFWSDKNRANVVCVPFDAPITKNVSAGYRLSDNVEDVTYKTRIVAQYTPFEIKTAIEGGLEGASKEERKIFRLYMEGYDVDYIAGKFRKSRKTIYNIISEIKRRIQNKLK